MALIEVRQLSINKGGGASLPNSFSDVFTRANSGNIGPAWGVTPIATTNIAAGEVPTINNNLLRCSSSIGSERTMLYPLSLAWMTQIQFQNQFAECTVFAVPAAFAIELAVVMSPNLFPTTNGFYCLTWDGATSVKIQKATWAGAQLSNNSPPNFVQLLDTGVFAATSHILRLEAINVAGVWTLTAKRFGVVIGTITDSSLSFGMPGLEVALAGAENIDIQEFAAGTL